MSNRVASLLGINCNSSRSRKGQLLVLAFYKLWDFLELKKDPPSHAMSLDCSISLLIHTFFFWSSCYRQRSLLWKARVLHRWCTMVWDCRKASLQITLETRECRHSLPPVHQREQGWLSSKSCCGLNIGVSHAKLVIKHRLQLCSLKMGKPALYSKEHLFQLLGRLHTEDYWETEHFGVFFFPQIKWKHTEVLFVLRWMSNLGLNSHEPSCEFLQMTSTLQNF